MATIETFMKGFPRDRYLATIARALWYYLARADVTPIYQHVPGQGCQCQNLITNWPDLLFNLKDLPGRYSWPSI